MTSGEEKKSVKATGFGRNTGKVAQDNSKSTNAAEPSKKEKGRKPEADVFTVAGQLFPRRKVSDIQRQASICKGSLGNLNDSDGEDT